MLTITPITRQYVSIDVASTLSTGAPAVISGVDVALVPPRSAPIGTTAWVSAAYSAGTATVLVAGYDASPTGALVVPAGQGADLWIRVVDSPEVTATKVFRILVLEGPSGAETVVSGTPFVTSVAGLTGIVSGSALLAALGGGVGTPTITGAIPVLATTDTAVADAHPEYVWLILAPTTAPDTTAPSVPTGLTATPGDTQVALSWTASTDNVGVTGYRVYRGGTLIASPTGTSYTDTGLTNGTSYSYTVAAADAAGNVSAQTSAVTATPTAAATVPGQPTGLTATPGAAQVGLSWTAPASNGGSAITDYKVEYRTGTNAFATFAEGTSTATTATVTGLTNGTAYDFRVSAINAIGTGTPSATATATPTAGSAATIVSKVNTVVLPAVGGNTRSITLPPTVAAGDILVILAAVNDPPAYTFTVPSGWTTSLINGDAGSGNQGFCLTKTATGSEGGTSIATTWNVGPDEALIAESYALRGVAAETPVATGSGTFSFNSGPTCPALTGLPADTMVLAAGWAHTGATAATTTPPTGMTEDQAVSTGNQTASFTHQYLASGGSAGGNAWTFTGSGNGSALAVAFS